MIWRAGKIVRFRSLHAEAEMQALAERLHGRCKRTGAREITITKTVRWVLDLPARDQAPRLTIEEIYDYGLNGHNDADRLVRQV